MFCWIYGSTRRDKVNDADGFVKLGIASRSEDARKPPTVVWLYTAYIDKFISSLMSRVWWKKNHNFSIESFFYNLLKL